MGKIAFLFSGQGAQYVGMGRAFYEQNDTARRLFDEAEALRPGTMAQCFEGDAEQLKQTENTQPCLYLADLAAALALRDAGVSPDAVAGFSLGELPALAFAGAFTPTEGFRLTVRRGQLMGACAKAYPASMMAVLKLPNETVEQLCAAQKAVYPVNYNSPGQLVVSGAADELPAFTEAVRTAGGRAVPLAVGGGFHSPFMAEAATQFAAVLADAAWATPTLPVYANATAEPYAGDMRALLAHQLAHPVLWERTIRAMSAAGVDTFIETGVGNTLQKLVSRILPDAKAYAVGSPDEVKEVAAHVNG